MVENPVRIGQGLGEMMWKGCICVLFISIIYLVSLMYIDNNITNT